MASTHRPSSVYMGREREKRKMVGGKRKGQTVLPLSGLWTCGSELPVHNERSEEDRGRRWYTSRRGKETFRDANILQTLLP